MEDKIQLITDQPITSSVSDVLNRSFLVNEISQTIITAPNQEGSYTIGIEGKWGSGKTSLINLIKEQLSFEKLKRKDIKFSNNIKYPIIIDYKPWNMLSQEGVISEFFNVIEEAFIYKKVSKHIKKILNLLKKSLDTVFEITSLIPGASKLKKLYNGIKKNIIEYKKIIMGDDKKSNTLLINKEKIRKKLELTPFNYIIVIDDLDRLNNDEIRLIFQLIKSVFDFPNVIYLISYDKRIVANALKNEQINGYEYMEKFIQIEYTLPKIGNKKIIEEINNKIILLCNQYEIEYYQKTYYNYIERGLFSSIDTIRTVKRFISRLSIQFERFVDEIGLYDYISIEYLRFIYPRFIDFIEDEVNILNVSLITEIEKQKIVNQLESFINQRDIGLIKILFKGLYSNSKEYTLDTNFNKKWSIYMENIFPQQGYSRKEIYDKLQNGDIHNFFSNEELFGYELRGIQYAIAKSHDFNLFEGIIMHYFTNTLNSEIICDYLKKLKDGIYIILKELYDKFDSKMITDYLIKVINQKKTIPSYLANIIYSLAYHNGRYDSQYSEMNIDKSDLDRLVKLSVTIIQDGFDKHIYSYWGIVLLYKENQINYDDFRTGAGKLDLNKIFKTYQVSYYTSIKSNGKYNEYYNTYGFHKDFIDNLVTQEDWIYIQNEIYNIQDRKDLFLLLILNMYINMDYRKNLNYDSWYTYHDVNDYIENNNINVELYDSEPNF